MDKGWLSTMKLCRLCKKEISSTSKKKNKLRFYCDDYCKYLTYLVMYDKMTRAKALSLVKSRNKPVSKAIERQIDKSYY